MKLFELDLVHIRNDTINESTAYSTCHEKCRILIKLFEFALLEMECLVMLPLTVLTFWETLCRGRIRGRLKREIQFATLSRKVHSTESQTPPADHGAITHCQGRACRQSIPVSQLRDKAMQLYAAG